MPVNLPYPLQFDPSQMQNPYTKWAGVGMPWYGMTIDSSGTYGNQVPTDAYGNPDQSYVDANNASQATYQQQQADYQKALAAYNAGGSSSSSTPSSASGSTASGSAASGLSAAQQSALGQWGPAINELMGNAAAANPTAASNPNAALISYIQSQDQNMQPAGNQGGFGSGNSGPLSEAQRNQMVSDSLMIQNLQQQGATAPAATSTAPTPPSQPNMTQAYIAALQKPNYVVTPGATVPQSAPPSTQSNVLQQFLANWKPGANPAGNYNNQSIIDAMRGNV